MRSSVRWLALLGVALVVASSSGRTAQAEPAYYAIKLNDLKVTEGAFPKEEGTPQWRAWERARAMAPYVLLDGKGEVYVTFEMEQFGRRSWTRVPLESTSLVACLPEPRQLTGRIFFPKPDWSGMVEVRFAMAADSARSDAKEEFLRGKKEHFAQLLDREVPGGAWFRHEMLAAENELTHKKSADDAARALQRRPRESELVRSFAMMSGGRAVSENLQLDRPLRNVKDDEATVDVDSLPGIDVGEIDWKPLLKDASPKLDPLAAKIPADQHAVFFPSFTAAVAVADEAERQGTPLLRMAEPRSEDSRTLARYEQQLGLTLSGLGRLIGPQVIKSVALTGSDPYYRTGTDVAVLFETDNPGVLAKLLATQIAMVSQKVPDAKPISGKAGGLSFQGMRSPDRSVCSYLAQLDNAVVVTNSPAALERLASVQGGSLPSIAALPEFQFFRNRYKLGEAEESALIFIGDKTIRRWCGPRWRIATSRQMRDAAVMAELQARQMDRLASGKVQAGPIYADLAVGQPAEFSLDARGVHSSVQNSLAFLTPIVEIPLGKVSKSEADAYKQWRDQYQRYWRGMFDPIALRLSIGKEKLAGDMTIMPLIFGTDYRDFVALSQGVQIAPEAGDRHDAILHFILAINKSAPRFREANNFLSNVLHGQTFGWLGSSIAVYFDDDPLWQELAELRAKDPKFNLDTHFEKHFGRLPLAVQFEVSNGLKLAAFVSGLRAFVEQTAPGMTVWETKRHKIQPYVQVSPSESAKGMHKSLNELHLYYVATGDALIASLREDVIRRAIDRMIARNAAQAAGSSAEKPKPDGKPDPAAVPAVGAAANKGGWLGSHLSVEADRKALLMFASLGSDSFEAFEQTAAWGNLPILNTWKQRYPDQDPVALHERVWHVRLTCPGGGAYVWNDKWQTMESTVYGHPGQPKRSPDLAMKTALAQFAKAAFGVTFENQGLRAQVVLERPAKQSK